ncbi:hypothetical protein CSC17_2536 [Klebsiella oxytoca]|nr:hypothetical protein CSC17_2536 [Klebsiella oxytoca]
MKYFSGLRQKINLWISLFTVFSGQDENHPRRVIALWINQV